MNWFSSTQEFLAGRIEDLQDRASDLRDTLFEAVDRAVSSYTQWRESEEGEREFFDEEETRAETDEARADIDQAQADLDEARADIDQAQVDLDEARTDIDQAQAEKFPDWMTDEQINEAVNSGISDYDDLTDDEKDFFIPGWRGFEASDEPAQEYDQTEMKRFRNEMAEELDLSPEQMKDISDDDLLTLSIIGDTHEIGLAREFSELEPEELAEELELNYRMTFEDIEALLNSKLYEFIMERPDLFDLDIHDDGSIDVYEDEES